ncbi:uncharacterized protein LOC129247455 [Anastrepha obliqua]|uniref:uncharacterized protein LOC129247455 n=1 Tax=Anastrepha obliqua TaxID=95512 RepID=UPI002409AD68|nr:uncharacterized protein LOC129247455 [Anastrepha obliqua]
MDLSSSEFAKESTGALCVKLAPNSVGLSVEPVNSNILENDEEDGEDFSGESSDDYIPETDEEEDSLEGKIEKSSVKQHEVLCEIAEESNGENVELKVTRKRKRKSQLWMQNKRKSDRSQGKAYVTKSDKVIKERLPKPADCSCHHNADYWSLGDYCKQRLFLSNNIKVEKCKRTLTRESRRSNTLKYFLNDKQVCKKFFLNTLHVSDCAISVLAKKKNQREFVDMRGKHGMQRKVDEEIANLIKEHIESFPAVESHYTRAKSQRLYLSSDLTITKMYNLFKERHPDLSVKEHMYRHIFCNNYNYSFHHPKKDTCSTCEMFKNTEDKASIQKSYDEHLANKAQARLHKDADKELSKNNSNIKVFTFDLQSVLLTQCSNVSTLYYSRKFATYNNTFYDLASGAGYCFLWDENHGHRGSEEIGTTLLKMLNNLPESVTNSVFRLLWRTE